MKNQQLSHAELMELIHNWLVEWNTHNLENVLSVLHEEVIFENFTGAKITGRKNLRRAWAPWFNNHGNFTFITEDLFADPSQQKVLLQWELKWPSPEKTFEGLPESRRGVDVIHFKDGLIYRKYSYSKTTIYIQDKPIVLSTKL